MNAPKTQVQEETLLPNIKSAVKRVKVSERRQLRNKAAKSRARTMVSNVRRAADAGDVQTAQAHLREALSTLDKTAQKGIIHKKNAARRKSRLMKALAKAQAQEQ